MKYLWEFPYIQKLRSHLRSSHSFHSLVLKEAKVAVIFLSFPIFLSQFVMLLSKSHYSILYNLAFLVFFNQLEGMKFLSGLMIKVFLFFLVSQYLSSSLEFFQAFCQVRYLFELLNKHLTINSHLHYPLFAFLSIFSLPHNNILGLWLEE